MTDAVETLEDSEYRTRTAHIYPELTGDSDAVLIVITDSEVDPPVEKFDVLDALQISKDEWGTRSTEGNDNSIVLLRKPPFARGWVQVGTLFKSTVDKVLFDNNYIDTETEIDDIFDVSAFTARPVNIRVVSPGEKRPFQAGS